MKLMNKLFAALVLFGVSNAAFGHDFTFTNKTNKSVDVAVKERNMLDLEPSQAQIMPGDSHTFSFKGNDCLERVWLNKEPIKSPLKGKDACKNAELVIMNLQGKTVLIEEGIVTLE